MPFFMMFDPLYLLFVALPSLVLLGLSTLAVKGSFHKYSQINNSKRITGAQAAEQILRNHGISNVRIERVGGKLTDHFDPKTLTIRLSDKVYSSTSIAAVGIAAHEAGHAVQHAERYAPMKIRHAIVPICNFGSSVGIWIMILGFIIEGFEFLVPVGILLFSTVVIFQLVTLPVEFNASRRAMQSIHSLQLLEHNEAKGARKVLTAAAMTYVAAMLQSVITVLFWIIRARGRR